MRRLSAAVLVVVALVALAALALGSTQKSASAASQYQYGKKPGLTLSVTNLTSSSYVLHLFGSAYFSGNPGGNVVLTCGGKKGSTCGPTPPPWDPGAVDPDGNFSLDLAQLDCGSNVKSAKAVDVNGVTSNSVKGPC